MLIISIIYGQSAHNEWEQYKIFENLQNATRMKIKISYFDKAIRVPYFERFFESEITK